MSHNITLFFVFVFKTILKVIKQFNQMNDLVDRYSDTSERDQFITTTLLFGCHVGLLKTELETTTESNSTVLYCTFLINPFDSWSWGARNTKVFGFNFAIVCFAWCILVQTLANLSLCIFLLFVQYNLNSSSHSTVVNSILSQCGPVKTREKSIWAIMQKSWTLLKVAYKYKKLISWVF